jgi:hypothetical protein
MRDKERAVSFYDLSIESKLYGHDDIKIDPVPISEALDIAFNKMGGTSFSLGTGHIKVTLADWKRAGRDHYLVINRADASLTDIPLRNLDTGHVRMAGKQKREGIDLTCHVLIRESQRPKRPALLLFTNGSNLPTDKICRLLGHLFRSARDNPNHAHYFERPHPNGIAGRMLNLSSHFTVTGHQNATLEHILKGGTLEGIELISEKETSSFDSANPLGLSEVNYRLVPQTDKRIGLPIIRRAIDWVTNSTGDKPTKARVRYKPPGRSKIESHTFEDIAALESAFVRRDTIRFNDPVAPRYERVEMRVVNELLNLANRENV